MVVKYFLMSTLYSNCYDPDQGEEISVGYLLIARNIN
jgi:hypothetical protein